MTDPDDPAFEPLIWKQMPLTKREYFAAMAMQGIVANNRLIGSVSEMQDDDFEVWDAEKAVALADALIAELNKVKS